MPKFYNRDGTLTRYALACGYVDIITEPRGLRPVDADLSVRLEQTCSNGVIRVVSSGRYLRREDYSGISLKDARKAWRSAARNLKRDEETARRDYQSV